jgi:hypothetical protein
MIKTVNLGPEHDEALQQAVLSVLRDLGAELDGSSWGLGGSQEIVTRRGKVNGSDISLEAETYIGLTVTGDEGIVEEIAKRTSERFGRP